MANTILSNAKNDEFYTQYADIEKEIIAYLDYNLEVFRNKTILLPRNEPEWSNFTKFFAQNFERFGLKKLISTSYTHNSKNYNSNYQPAIFETNAPHYDQTQTITNGKFFTLTANNPGGNKIDIDDLQWQYLAKKTKCGSVQQILIQVCILKYHQILCMQILTSLKKSAMVKKLTEYPVFVGSPTSSTEKDTNHYH